mgnify:CR=1 FL=1
MAYNTKDVFYLDTSISTTTGAGDGCATLDLSSYVSPYTKGTTKKGQGLAIYKVHWDIADSGSNGPVNPATSGYLRAALLSFSGVPAAAVGGVNLTANQLNAGNDLCISGFDYFAGSTAEGDPAPYTWLEPSTEVPYIVVRDQVALLVEVSTAISATAIIYARLECAVVTLDQSVLNQLLRTQTV